MKRLLVWDYLIMGEIVLIGLAETAHLAAVFLDWPFGRCTLLFGGLVGLAAVAGAVFAFLCGKRRRAGEADAGGKRPVCGRAELALYAVFGLCVLSQLIFICMGNTDYRQGDMTVETVGSFLASDGVYRVNPMTGLPYTKGMPLRLKILCLPSLYGFLCKITGLAPVTVVRTLIPVITLCGCYAAFAALAAGLFPEEEYPAAGRYRACFMTVVSFLMWAGAYGEGVDGFSLLVCGWRGTAIRGCVLLPWLLSLCVRRKWFWTVFCILAEACIVWTLYGCGVCLIVTAGMAAAGLAVRRQGKGCQGDKRNAPWQEEELI